MSTDRPSRDRLGLPVLSRRSARASGTSETGVLCTCDHYEPVEERLLIVKLDAMGDVLRSTALLPPLAEVHPRAAITWITRKESVPLLQRNPYIAEVLELGPEALVHLQTRTSIA